MQRCTVLMCSPAWIFLCAHSPSGITCWEVFYYLVFPACPSTYFWAISIINFMLIFSLVRDRLLLLRRPSIPVLPQGENIPPLELWPLAKFHTQIWQFWKLGHISKTTARRANISSISPPWGRKRMFVQLLEFRPLDKFHAQIWHFLKSARISETATRRAKIS